MIVSLYAGGMTIRDISTIWPPRSARTCRTRRSRKSPKVADEAIKWQQRDLEPLYPVMYLGDRGQGP
ncbi:MAG: hypothetical protein R2768_06570 [Gordonia sp. (in: high G+C Gram-positive bacteria)]